jgi:hypothetical protein
VHGAASLVVLAAGMLLLLGVRAYSEFGWGGIAGLTALASAAALTRHLAHRRSAGAALASQAQETSAAAADQVSCP